MARYKCLVNGSIDESARAEVEAGLASIAAQHFGVEPTGVSVEFIEVTEGLWYTAGQPSQASMVLGTVPPGTTQDTRIAVLESMARLFSNATGADFDDVMVVAADERVAVADKP